MHESKWLTAILALVWSVMTLQHHPMQQERLAACRSRFRSASRFLLWALGPTMICCLVFVLFALWMPTADSPTLFNSGPDHVNESSASKEMGAHKRSLIVILDPQAAPQHRSRVPVIDIGTET